MKAAAGASTRRAGGLRRSWPAIVMACGLFFSVVAVGLGQYIDDRIVLLGPVDAVTLVVLSAIAAIWCVAAFLIGTVTRLARGRVGEFLSLAVVVPAIVLGALALTVLASLLINIGLGHAPQYKLDMPDGSIKYIVVPFTFGETSLALFRGNGIVYNRLGTPLPYVDRSSSFGDAYRVETDEDGRSFLIYPKEGGGQARVPLLAE